MAAIVSAPGRRYFKVLEVKEIATMVISRVHLREKIFVAVEAALRFISTPGHLI